MTASPPAFHGHGAFRYCPNCGQALSPVESGGRVRPGCPACGYVHYEDPKLAAGVLLGGPEGVLLMQRAHAPRKGFWSFPSGYVDAGEAVEDAAIRETLEEVLVPIRLDGLLGVYSQPGERVVLVVYRGSILSGEPRPGPESSAVGFFHPQRLPDLAFPRDRRIVQDWLAALGSPLPLL